MEIPSIFNLTGQIAQLAATGFVLYNLFIRKKNEHPELEKLEVRRWELFLWMVTVFFIGLILSFPVFIMLYPDDIGNLSTRLKGILVIWFQIIILLFVIINLFLWRKKRKIKKEEISKNQTQL
ncbi:MAG: hypothetical protein KA166_02180 [Saprospiraceae bacterium]|nr:hypothetical protein [Saprospiraceae bacterium]